MRMEADHIISKFNGVRPLARLLNYPAATVQNWLTRNSIPSKHWALLISVGENAGLNITINDFIPNIDKKSKPKRRR